MKKIVTVCILILTICLLCAGTVFADTQTNDGQTFYIAKEDITVYVYSDGAPKPGFIIPKTYYFRTLSNNGDYTSIAYNNTNSAYSVSLYLKTSDIASKAAVTTDSVTDETAYFDLTFTVENKTALYYKPGNLDSSPTTGEYVIMRDFLGVYQYGNSVYFATVVESNSNFSVMLVNAADTSKMSFTLAQIPLHQNTIDRNNAENEGVISTPGEGNTDATKNNVIRNVMIAVICIMCVLVIFLIFRPTKNAKNRYELDNRENAERGYNDPRR